MHFFSGCTCSDGTDEAADLIDMMPLGDEYLGPQDGKDQTIEEPEVMPTTPSTHSELDSEEIHDIPTPLHSEDFAIPATPRSELSEYTEDIFDIGATVHYICSEEAIMAIPRTPSAHSLDISDDVFEVCLEKPEGAHMGWTVDSLDQRHLFICELKPGPSPISEYNEHAPPEEKIEVGCYVVGLNGLSGSSEAMQHAIAKSDKIGMWIARPFVFEIQVDKTNSSLGLDLVYGAYGSSILVEAVSEKGFIHAKHDVVRIGDRVISVNGLEGQASELMEALRQVQRLKITFSRAATSRQDKVEQVTTRSRPLF